MRKGDRGDGRGPRTREAPHWPVGALGWPAAIGAGPVRFDPALRTASEVLAERAAHVRQEGGSR